MTHKLFTKNGGSIWQCLCGARFEPINILGDKGRPGTWQMVIPHNG